MANDQLRTVTTEATARLFSRSADPMVAGDTIVRGWTEVDATVADTLVTTLRAVTTVTDPKADGQTISGKFVVSGVVAEEGNDRWVTIRQVLTKVDTAITDDDWTGFREILDPVPVGDQVIREARNIDPFSMDTILSALDDDTTHDSIYIDGTEYEVTNGLWVNSKVEAIVQDNKTVTIRQTLTAAFKYDEGISTPLELGQTEVLDAFSLVEGTNNVIGYRYLYLNPLTRSDWMSLSITKPDATYSEVDRQFRVESADRTGTMDVLWRLPSWVAWSNQAATTTEYANRGFDGEVRIKTWPGIAKGDIVAAMTSISQDSGTVGNDAGFHVVRADVTDNKDGSITLVQTQVKTMSETATGGTLVQQQVVDALGLASGTIDGLETIYRNYDDTDLAAISESTPSGYTLTAVSTDQDERGLFTRRYSYSKATWTSWTNQAATTTEYANRGFDGEIRTKTWLGIDKGDLTTAMDAISQDGGAVGNDAGFHVVRADVTDNKDGSITLVQTQVKAMSETAAGGTLVQQQVIDALGLVSGTLDSLESVYRNFDDTDLAAISESAPAGYTQSEIRTTQDDRGLFTRSYVYVKASWAPWTNQAATTTEYANRGFDGEVRTKTWLGIDKGDLTTAMDAISQDSGAVGNDAGFHVVRADVTDNKDGSITLVQTQVKAMSETAAGGTLVQQQVIDALGLVSGTLDSLESVYRNFDDTDLAAISESAPAGYTQSDIRTTQDDRGLFTRSYVYVKATWTPWSTLGVIVDYTTIEYANRGLDGEVRTKTWLGIAKGDLDDAMNAISEDSGAVGNDTGFHVVRADVTDNKDGSITLVQTQVKAMSETADGGLLVQQQVIDALGLVSGTLDSLESVYRNFDDTDLAAISESAPAGYTQSDIRTTQDSNGFFTRRYVYIKVTWTEWSSSPDATMTEYLDYGGERDAKVNTWDGIAKAGMPTAVAALLVGTAPATIQADERVVRVSVRDNRNGSISLTQYVVEKLGSGTQVDTASTETVNPHGFISGSIAIVEVLADDFDEADLAAVPSATPAGVLVSRRVSMNGRGYYNLVARYENPSWIGNPVTTGEPTTSKLISRSGELSENDFGKRETVIWPGLDIDDTEDVVAARSAQSTADYVVAAVQARVGNNGDVDIIETRQYIGTDSSSANGLEQDISYEAAGSSSARTETKVKYWPNLTPALAASLVSSLKGSLGLDGGTYRVVRITQQRDPDTGLITVTAHGAVEGTDYYPGLEILTWDQRIEVGFVTPGGAPTTYRINIDRKCFDTRAAAFTYANASTTRALGYGWYSNLNEPGGRVFYSLRHRLWIADKETWTVSPSGPFG